ncbi:18800_t:CDS:1, partial [Funneliformis geosporum]
MISQHFKGQSYSNKQIALASCKEVEPYKYINSQDRFLGTKLLPIYEYTTKLYGKITQEDYEYAQKIWKEFGCKNL